MHHGDELGKRFREEAERAGLGATGHYPEGALDETDQGELKLAIAADPKAGKVLVNFGKPVAWFGMTPQQARELAESLRQRSYEAEGKKPKR
jgi:hypothetical protein